MTEEPNPQADDVAVSTGDDQVDAALARLDDLDERDLDEHADVYDAAHNDLAEVLDDAGTPATS